MNTPNSTEQKPEDTRDFGPGSEKPPRPDDPLQMQAASVTGDQRLMLECLIEEFARMGWDGNHIERLFENPFFLASHGLEKRFGREAVRACIAQTLQRCGVFRVQMSESKQARTSQVVTIAAGRGPRSAGNK